MHADIGGASVVIARLPRRRAKAQLFTASGRGLLVAAIAVMALVIGLGALTDYAHSAPHTATPQPAPYGYIGR
jgi:hypothetical protein